MQKGEENYKGRRKIMSNNTKYNVINDDGNGHRSYVERNVYVSGMYLVQSNM